MQARYNIKRKVVYVKTITMIVYYAFYVHRKET